MHQTENVISCGLLEVKNNEQSSSWKVLAGPVRLELRLTLGVFLEGYPVLLHRVLQKGERNAVLIIVKTAEIPKNKTLNSNLNFEPLHFF